MKNIYLFICAICAVMLTTACENGHNNDLPNNPNESECYEGTMVVDQNDGSHYTQTNVEVDYEINGDKLNFVMYKVKFAKGMPLKLDMVVEGVDYVENNGTYTLTGNNLVPYAMGGPFDKFTITNLTGEITDSSFTLDFMCGEYPLSYEGTK